MDVHLWEQAIALVIRKLICRFCSGTGRLLFLDNHRFEPPKRLFERIRIDRNAKVMLFMENATNSTVHENTFFNLLADVDSFSLIMLAYKRLAMSVTLEDDRKVYLELYTTKIYTILRASKKGLIDGGF